MCSNNKHVKPNDEEIVRVNVTLEQVQGLLRPPLTNSSTIVVIEGVEFEDFQVKRYSKNIQFIILVYLFLMTLLNVTGGTDYRESYKLIND